jgi:hypothetical protein
VTDRSATTSHRDIFHPYHEISWVVCGRKILKYLLNDSLTVHPSESLASTSCLRVSLVHMQVMLINRWFELTTAVYWRLDVSVRSPRLSLGIS